MITAVACLCQMRDNLLEERIELRWPGESAAAELAKSQLQVGFNICMTESAVKNWLRHVTLWSRVTRALERSDLSPNLEYTLLVAIR